MATTKPDKTTRVPRKARLSTRSTEETKRAIRKKADVLIRAHELLDMSADASRAMITAWLDPAPLPAKLADALAAHDALVLSGG